MARPHLLALCVLAALAAVVALDAAVTLMRDDVPAARAAADGLDRPVPRLSLRDADGRATSLAAFRGRWLVLAPLATRCRESCPLTTGALLRIQAVVRRRGLGARVAVAAATVDAWHDTPARLRAFRRRTGARLRLLTGTPAQLRRLWRFFGVHYARAGDDVEHTDGVFVVDPRGHWRAAFAGTPDLGGRLPPALAAELDAKGREELRRPVAPWSLAAVLAAAGLPRARSAAAPPAPGPLLGGGATAFRSRLDDLRGTPVVVNAWASWCPPCRAESPLLAAAAQRYGGRVAFVGLSVTDADGAARRFLAAHPAGYPSYADPTGAAARALGAPQGLPVTLFVDARGRVAHVHAGAYPTAAALEDDLRSALLR